MSVNRYIEEYKDTPKELELIASKGQRVFLGTKAAVDSAIKAGDIGNYSVVYTTDDFEADLYPDKVEVGCVNTENIPIEVPAGSIQDFAGDIAPEGYFICDGASKNTADYPRLFAVIGYKFGGSGSTFNLPDFRNRYAIGKGDREETNTIGNIIEGAVKSHTHNAGSMYADTSGYTADGTKYYSSSHNHTNGLATDRYDTSLSDWAWYGGTRESYSSQKFINSFAPGMLGYYGIYTSSNTHKHPVAGSTGTSGGSYNYVDSLVVNKIIKY